MGLPHVALRPFGRAENLELEFGDCDRPGLVTDLLARCSDSQRTQFWWTQTVGTRIGAVLRLLALTGSADSLPVQARCSQPACADANFEMELPLAALVDQAQDFVPSLPWSYPRTARCRCGGPPEKIYATGTARGMGRARKRWRR